MTDDIRLAFAHPSERAAASTDIPYDRISLRDYVVEVEIGAFQQERGHLQRVRFNVVVEVLPQTGPIDDDVDNNDEESLSRYVQIAPSAGGSLK